MIIEKARLQQILLGSTILGLVAFATHAIFYAPMILSDDWSFLEQALRGSLRWVVWTDKRPLLLLPMRVVYGLFGLRIDYYYAVLAVLDLLAAILLMVLIFKLLPDWPQLAIIAATLSLIYPADFTHTWITTFINRSALCLTYIYALLLLIYAHDRRFLLLVAAICCLLLSFGIYDAQLGIAMAWSCFLAFRERGMSWRLRIALLSPLVLGFVFAAWRTVGVSIVGISNNRVSEMQLNPAVLLARLWLAFKVLIYAWCEPAKLMLNSESNWLALMVLALAILTLLSMSIILGRFWRNRQVTGTRVADGSAMPVIQDCLRCTAIALGFVVAGYLPVVTVNNPNLQGFSSRVNMFAIPGASFVAVLLLGMLAQCFARDRQRAGKLVIAAAMPLFLLGFVTQFRIAYNNNHSWQEQKTIWTELFSITPRLSAGTGVYFVLPGYQERNGFISWQLPPLSSSWETSSALRILYGSSQIHADVIFPGVDSADEPRLTNTGISDRFSGVVTPYSQALFVAFDGSPRKLRVLDRSEAVRYIRPGSDLETYAPEQHFTAGALPLTDYRYLVGAATTSPVN